MNKIETNQNHFSQTDANLEEKNLSQSQHKPQQLLNWSTKVRAKSLLPTQKTQNHNSQFKQNFHFKDHCLQFAEHPNNLLKQIDQQRATLNLPKIENPISIKH